MKFKLVLKSVLAIALVVFVISCDDDYNELGTNILGGDHYNLEQYPTIFPDAFTQTTGPVQTSDLPVNSLGVYKMGDFGTVKASYLTQVGLSQGNLKIYKDLTASATDAYKIDSVYVYIPYYSTLKSTNSETGNSTYELDSIMPSAYTGKKIKLEIKRSTLELNQYDLDEGLTQIKKYYSNDQTFIEGNLSDVLLSKEIQAKDDQIIFYKNKIVANDTLPGSTDVDSRLAPGIFELLADKAYFENLLKDAKTEGALLNNNTFRNFFKGLYIKADTPSSLNVTDGFMARFNFANAKIVIIYHDYYSSTVTTPTRKVLSLGFSGRSVNVFDTSDATPIADGNISGDDRVFVKGGEGAQAIIKIPQTAIGDLKAMNAKINDATITFTIDSDFNDDSANIAYPKRFYLYDMETRRVLLDYSDPTTATATKYNKYIYGGIEKTIDGKKRVKFNITNHLRNLVRTFKADEAEQDTIGNYKLGLAITENINVASLYRRKNIINNNSEYKNKVKYLPIMSICSPLGTKFYGSVPANGNTDDTRVKLEIWYTKQED